ncbi:MAG: ATP-grasp domain-containing protein [Gammaproteobacteria bacterium]|nr:MAG: ATP-grasp domain-containing protein [Gammaproteobacteria bacterium]
MSPAPVIAITGMNAKPDNPGPGMAVARCIKESAELKAKIIGLSYDVLDPGMYRSEYADASYLIPYPSSGEDALCSRLEQISALEKIDILIPCLDAELKTIARIKPRLEALGIKVLSPNEEQIDLRAKDNLPRLAQMAGIKTPAVTKITSADFFHTCHKHGWGFPMVVKGVFYDAYIAHSPAEAVGAFHKIALEWGYPILVQEFISGEEVNLTALGDGKGNMLGAVMMKKRAITDKGKAWAGISIADKRLENAASKIVEASNWQGALEVEVMVDKNNNYYLIEINPRFPAWIYLSRGVGRNLPELLVNLVLNEEYEDKTTTNYSDYKSGVLFIRYAEELILDLEKFESMIMHGFTNNLS